MWGKIKAFIKEWGGLALSFSVFCSIVGAAMGYAQNTTEIRNNKKAVEEIKTEVQKRIDFDLEQTTRLERIATIQERTVKTLDRLEDRIYGQPIENDSAIRTGPSF